MGRQAAVVLALYVLALVAGVVGVDVLFFRNRFWERLIVNVGIVLVFWAFLSEVPEASVSAAAMRGRARRGQGAEDATTRRVVQRALAQKAGLFEYPVAKTEKRQACARIKPVSRYDLRSQIAGGSMVTVAELDRSFHLHPFTSVPGLLREGPTVIRRGHGAIVEDDRGRELIDAAAGLWCVNVGHGRREIVDAVAEQMNALAFFHTFNGMTNEPVAKLSARVLAHAPSNMRRVFFGNSGSDANDTAIKLVTLFNNLRGKEEKKKIIARWRGYHGVTVAAGSLTGLPGVHRLFDLPLPTVRHVDGPDQYHSPERKAADYAQDLENVILAEGPETVAAFIAEPVMGTGGVLVPPDDYFKAIRDVLDRYDVLLILDEIICGFGRLGAWFGADRFKVIPDLITCAKGLTSSYLPMSAVMIGERVWSEIENSNGVVDVFSHGFTTSGHPAAAAAALANLDILEREDLVEQAGKLGVRLVAQLREAVGDHPLVGDVRGCGLMAGVELVADRYTRRNFPIEAKVALRVAKAAVEAGVLVRALPANDVMAFSPAFVIAPELIDECVTRFARALDRVLDQLQKEAA